MSNLEPKVFISHSSIDDAIARDLEAWLTRVGFECWAYYNEVDRDLRASIDIAIESHSFFLLIASQSSHQSDEVCLEIHQAFDRKRDIYIYRLDQHPYAIGIRMILNPVKWIDARSHNVDSFSALAKQMLKSIRLDDCVINERISSVIHGIQAQQDQEKKRKKLQLEKWLDKLWSYRYDYELKKSRTLTTWHKIELRQYGDELGIDEEARIKLLRQYKRDLRGFKSTLYRALNSMKLEKRDIMVLEQARIDCCIPLEEAGHLIEEQLSKYSENVTLTKGAAAQDSWIVSIIKGYVEVQGAQLSNKSIEVDCLNEDLLTPSSQDKKSTVDSAPQVREPDQHTIKALERDQVSQSIDATKDDIKINSGKSKNLLEIELKCDMRWAIREETPGKCWLRRIEKRADSLYFWGFGCDLSVALQDIQSILVNDSSMEVQLCDGVSNAEINFFDNEILCGDLISFFSSQGIQIVYSLRKTSRSVQDLASSGWRQVDSCAIDVSTQPASQAEILSAEPNASQYLSSLWNDSEIDAHKNKVAQIIDSFRDADTSLFKTLGYYVNDHAARAKALRNHGLDKLAIQDICLFINASVFRGKNGILVCDCLLSIKNFFQRPVHFDFFSPVGGLLALDAVVSDDAKINLVVKRESCQADGGTDCKIIQTFKIDVSSNSLTSLFHKELVERKLPALVRHLALIRKRSLEVI